ncbi:prostamide/prostaglandin F synthase [Elysia marginata]|uniref:Prostamide/prostaglandin F synthase n=1 Tax=Elysia marginata TaxID=1093978 RepID=A0AAV4J6L7_9GAST|nr:prostamide/prostaglandin F synthase [Elysia marginata]
MGAQQISQLKPRLDENKVRFVAVGLEELGVEDFVKGEFFKGELYIDLKKECYKKMGFRRLNFFTIFPSLFGKKTRETLSQSKEKGIDGNFAGDGWQNGGAFVVDKGGKALLTFKQESPGEHVDPNAVLKALGIEGAVETHPPEGAAAECNEEACALPTKKPTEPVCTDDACALPSKKSAEPVCTDDACAMPEKKTTAPECTDDACTLPQKS